MKILTINVFLILICFSGFSQTAKDSENLYFGQKPPGLNPEIFAKGIVSTNEFEFCGSFSQNGLEYFFTRRPSYQSSDNRIYHTKLVNGTWTKPVLAPFAQDVFEFEPVVSPFEDKVYFYSERKESRDDKYDGDLWFSEKINDHWTTPCYFSSPINKKWCMSVTSTETNALYFSGNFDGKRGIFRSENASGKYEEITYLSEDVNSNYYSHPYIAPDESYILMDGQPQGRGKSELFISFRNDFGEWTKPKNLGKVINATLTEFGASVSPDGKYLFFHRRVNGNGDIYWVDAEIIQQIKDSL